MTTWVPSGHDAPITSQLETSRHTPLKKVNLIPRLRVSSRRLLHKDVFGEGFLRIGASQDRT